MMERLERSWALTREAWDVLRQDRELALFPILSGICSFLVMVSFFVPLGLMLWPQVARGEGHRAEMGPVHYALIFLFYLASYFVVVFFNCGLVACARIRFAGGNPTLRDGLEFSTRNVGIIFQWALLSATVGMLLRWLQERTGWLGRIVIGLVGLAWSLATLFVVPVLVHERVGPIAALKRSAETFRRTWGEAVITNVGMSLAFNLLALPALLVVLAAVAGAIALAGTNGALAVAVLLGGIGLALVYGVALAIVHSTLQGIFLTACYEYATTGTVPSAFSQHHVAQAWRAK